MKLIKKILIIFLLLLFPINVFAFTFDINSNKVLLINLNDDEILYEQNPDDITSIASLTKMMTALVAIENIENLNEKVTINDVDYIDLIEKDASLSGLEKNKEYTYEELLYGLLLTSGADCANSLARNIANTKEEFVILMNEKAKELNMISTTFSNPIGFDDENNKSSATDVATLFKEAIKNETFKKIITTMNYQTEDNHILNNTIIEYENKFNLNMSYIIGGKTGYDTNAGYCLATIATYNNIDYMLITLNAPYNYYSPNHFLDAKNIYEYFMNNYDYQTIIDINSTLHTFKTKYIKEELIDIKATKSYKYYLPNNYDRNKINTVYKGIETISYDMKENDNLGTLEIYYENTLLDTIKINLNQKVNFNLISFYEQNHLALVITLIAIIILIQIIIHLLKRKKKHKTRK